MLKPEIVNISLCIFKCNLSLSYLLFQCYFSFPFFFFNTGMAYLILVQHSILHHRNFYHFVNDLWMFISKLKFYLFTFVLTYDRNKKYCFSVESQVYLIPKYQEVKFCECFTFSPLMLVFVYVNVLTFIHLRRWVVIS